MQVTYTDLEKSKIFIGSSEIYKFPSPIELVSPFMEEINTKIGNVSWTFEAEEGSKNANPDELSEENIAYSRVIAKAKLPAEYDLLVDDDTFNHLWSEIGLVYALDTKKPEMKVYRGKRVSVCTNQCVFGADNITGILLTSSRADIYERAAKYAKSAMEDVEKYRPILETLNGTVYSGSSLNEQIGKMFRYASSNPKLGITTMTGMLKSIQDDKTRYAIKNGAITGWTLYNACTEELKKSNILDESTKTLLLEKVFLN